MALSSGVYTLIGVIVGGSVSGSIQFALAARSDRLDLRVAKRQVRSELVMIGRNLDWLTVTTPEQGPMNATEFAEEALFRLRAFDIKEALRIDEMKREHGNTLARHLPDGAWDDISDAYAVADSFSHLSSAEELAERYESTVLAIRDAVERLA